MLNLWLSGPEVPAVGPVENTCRADSHTRSKVSSFVLSDDCFPKDETCVFLYASFHLVSLYYPHFVFSLNARPLCIFSKCTSRSTCN